MKRVVADSTILRRKIIFLTERSGPYGAHEQKIECVGSFEPNVTEKLLVRSGKSLKRIMEVCKYFDDICQLQPLSSHHTIASSMKDIDTVLKELLKSRVFDYTYLDGNTSLQHEVYSKLHA